MVLHMVVLPVTYINEFGLTKQRGKALIVHRLLGRRRRCCVLLECTRKTSFACAAFRLLHVAQTCLVAVAAAGCK